MEAEKLPQLFCGLLLILLGAFMPRIFHESVFPVLKYYRLSLAEESIHLITSAGLLVTMNILRAVPHYVGVYWVADSLNLRRGKKRIALFDAALILILLLLTYRLIEAINQIHYDFGLPAFLMAAIILLYDLLDYNYVSLFKRTLFILTSLMAVQFLDIMPAASFLPVGRGELSRYIKTAATVLEIEQQLNVLALVGFVTLTLISLMLFILIRDENGLREISSLREANARMRMETYASEIQNRTFREMQYLVHDLKSPLSVIRTLEGVLRIQEESETPEKKELFDRMEKATDQMSNRISQLLTPDRKEAFTVRELLHDVMQQISIEAYAPYVSTRSEIDDDVLYANQMLLSRSLVNLIQNAVQAVPEDRTPEIVLGACREDGQIVLSVTDNGIGVTRQQQENIWKHGYSGKNSSGMGLAFVKMAVERSGGQIRMQSRWQEGTEISLVLPGEGKEEIDGER
ncbi:MAG: HAMP domain-containing histidine kinase [Lachnospiraceae bacterium]|nr:HAMP domain-containing histidine kinase [Lachnospiraceae bacterium]